MYRDEVKILKNKKIAVDIYEMTLKPKKINLILPGQFINIQLDGLMLRRPISVCSIEKNVYKIIYKVVGAGTKKLTELNVGETLHSSMALGRSFPILNQEKILLIGGGVGIAPLYEVAKQYRQQKKHVDVVFGFNNKNDVFYEQEFKKLGCNVLIATTDGSYGYKGTVLDVITLKEINTEFIYGCGPLALLKALDEKYKHGYLLFEARMACGIGACMGCVFKIKHNKEKYYRICQEGPVLELGKVEF